MNDPIGEDVLENMPLLTDSKDSGTEPEDIKKTADFIEFSGDEGASDRVFISVPNYQLTRPVEEKLRSNRKTRQLSNHPLADASLSGPSIYRSRQTRTRAKSGHHSRFAINVKDTYWSIEERCDLISALKTYGMFDMFSLCREVPSKTESQLKEFMKVAWKTTHKNLNDAMNEKPEDEPETPITQWLDILEAAAKERGDRYAAYNLMLPKVFLFISKYGNHPEPEKCGGINYRDAYEFVYHMLCGLPGKTLSAETSRFVRRTLHALSLRARHASAEQLEFVGNVRRVPTAPAPADGRPGGSHEPDDRADRNALLEILKLPEANPFDVPIRILEYRNNTLGQD